MTKTYTLEGGYEDLIEHYFAKGWTDGLPIVPPSPRLLAPMLAAARRPASDVVAVMPPFGGEATIEAIAINAIMAGCLPEYLPVVLAAVEAVTDPSFNLHGIQTTTNPVAVMLIVNGPIARRLDINGKGNCLGPGFRANATIGRALNLVMRNIGGGVAPVTDKATHGQPGKFTMCFSENEEESPWEPWHVEHGFRADESTVTAITVTGTQALLDSASQTAEGILKTFAGACGSPGELNAQIGGAPLLILGPEHAAIIASGGHSKADFKRILFETSRIPIEAFPEETVRYKVRQVRGGLDERSRLEVPIADRAEAINVVVAGSAGSHSIYSVSFGPSTAPVLRRIPDAEPSR